MRKLGQKGIKQKIYKNGAAKSLKKYAKVKEKEKCTYKSTNNENKNCTTQQNYRQDRGANKIK